MARRLEICSLLGARLIWGLVETVLSHRLTSLSLSLFSSLPCVPCMWCPEHGSLAVVKLSSSGSGLKRECPQRPGWSWKASHDLALEISEPHIYQILLVKQVIKSNLDSKREELGTLNEQCNEESELALISHKSTLAHVTLWVRPLQGFPLLFR